MLKNVYRSTLGAFLVVFFPCVHVPVPICEEIHGVTSEVFNFFQSHSGVSYMASNFVYLEFIATYVRQHSKLGSCGQIPAFHQLDEGMQTLLFFLVLFVQQEIRREEVGKMGTERGSVLFHRRKLLPNMQLELHDSSYLVPKFHPFSSVEWFNWRTTPLGSLPGCSNVSRGHTKAHFSR